LGVETPEERAERLKAQFQKDRPTSPGIAPSVTPKFDADLIPDIEPPRLSDEDVRLNSFMDNFDILEGYRRFIGKMEPKESGRRKEGIMVSCPLPNHPDKNPSAWCNTDNNLWFCGGCQTGGDIYDLGAIHFGYSLDSYKHNGTFPVLKKQMAERLGYVVVKGIGGESYVVPQEAPEPEPPAPPTPTPLGAIPATNVVPLRVVEPPEDDELDEEILQATEINWKKLAPEETYLRAYMDACTIDDLPEEFHFWNGLVALSLAVGTKVYLSDFKPVKSNLFVCLYGRTGTGKSRSISPLQDVLQQAVPFHGDDLYSAPTGVLLQNTPGSAEALLDSFKWDILDPSSNKVIGQAPITGLVKIEELSGFIARASRAGSAMKEMFIEMYDVYSGEIGLRTRGAGNIRVVNPFMSVITTTQPKAIHLFMRRSDVETGFLNRIIWALGKPRRAPMSYGGFSVDVSAAAALLRNLATWASPGWRYEYDGDAFDAWDDFFHTNLAPMKTGAVESESMLSRIDLQLKKVINLVSANRMLAQPTGEVVEQVTQELYPYLSFTSASLTGDIAFNDTTECQNRLIQIINDYQEKYKQLPSARNITQNIGKRFDSELVIRALKNLLTLDIVYEDMPKAGGRGRPTKRYGLTTFGSVK
jgi:hypothetical protein